MSYPPYDPNKYTDDLAKEFAQAFNRYHIRIELLQAEVERLRSILVHANKLASGLPPGDPVILTSMGDMVADKPQFVPRSEYESLKADAKKWRECQERHRCPVCDKVAQLEPDAKRWRHLADAIMVGDPDGDQDVIVRNAKLGALVRDMPPGSELRHIDPLDGLKQWYVRSDQGSSDRYYDTPEEALRAALGDSQ